MDLLEASGNVTLPATLSMDDQINFFVGYHQEGRELWRSRKNDEEASDQDATESSEDNA